MAQTLINQRGSIKLGRTLVNARFKIIPFSFDHGQNGHIHGETARIAANKKITWQRPTVTD